MNSSQTDIVHRTGALARLEIAPEDVERLGAEFGRILESFRALEEIDVEGVEPLSGPSDLIDVLREDIPRPSLEPDVLLNQAPSREGNYYSVPRAIEQSS